MMRDVSYVLIPIPQTTSELFWPEHTSIKYETLFLNKSFDERFCLKGHDLFFLSIFRYIGPARILVYKHEFPGRKHRESSG